MDTQTERYNKQIQALQVTLDTEREKLMWTDQKLKEMSSKLSLSERNHLNSAKQTQDMQVCTTRMCPQCVLYTVNISSVLNVSTALIIVMFRWTYLDVTSWWYVNLMLCLLTLLLWYLMYTCRWNVQVSKRSNIAMLLWFSLYNQPTHVFWLLKWQKFHTMFAVVMYCAS